MSEPAFIPVLRVKDARKSAAFYASHLGFSTDWEHQFGPGFPRFISISRGTLQLFLSEHAGSGMERAELYVYLPEIDSLHTQLAAEGVTIEQPPGDQPWGVRDMQIRDLDQHRFTFAMRKG
jgi:uncharacterized glyoxalase superfamily protein PhnB